MMSSRTSKLQPNQEATTFAAALPLPDSLGEIDHALTALRAERAEKSAALAQLPGREKGLLEDGADDTALEALDAEARALRRGLLRLEYYERRLVDRAAVLDRQAKKEAWAGYATKMVQGADALLAAAAIAQERWRELNDLVAMSGSIDFPVHQNFLLPPGRIDLAPIQNFASGCRERLATIGKASDARPAPQPLGAVRFIRLWEMYSAGDRASFPAEQAHRLVSIGFATWEPGIRPPADPGLQIPPVRGPNGFIL